MNENHLMIFESPDFGQIRTVINQNEPWFAAVDVCNALEINNPRQAVTTLDDDEKMTVTTNDGHSGHRGGAQKMNVISEAGLYSLILRSRKPEAKAFKRWITHEVIPSIRKHGAYVADSVLEQLDENPEYVSDFIKQLKEENAEAKKNRELLEQARAENAKLAPKAGYYDNFVSADDLTCLRYTAKELGVKQNKFIGYLIEKGYAYRDRHREGRIFPKASKRNDPLFCVKDFYLSDGTKSEYTLVTPEGKAHFQKRADKIREWEPGLDRGETITQDAVFAE